MKSGKFVFHVDPVAPPGLTAGLSPVAGDKQVSLTWTGANGATGYSVGRSTTSGGPYHLIKSNVVGTNLIDSGLTNGTTYFYAVNATNAEGVGASSNEASAVPGPLNVPTSTVLAASPNPSTGDKRSSSRQR